MLELLKTLDPTDDTLWTEDGLPSLSAVQALLGDNAITRDDINKVALGLVRANVAEYTVPAKKVKKAKDEEVVVTPEVVVEQPQDALIAKVAQVRAELSAKLELKVQLESELTQLNQELFGLEIQLKPVDTSASNAEALAGYAQAAQAEREAKAIKMQKMIDSGLSLNEVKDLLGMNRKRKIEI
jgi:hypothetical protein